MMSSVFFRNLFFGSVFLAIGANWVAASESAKIQFPGSSSQLISPNGRYVLVNVDSEGPAMTSYLSDNHSLYLLDLKSTKVEKVRSYGRKVEALWSPQSLALLINDYEGSNSTRAIVYLVDKGKYFDVKDELRRRLGSNRSIFGNHHVHIVGTDWLAENKLQVKITGYGDVDPAGFTLWYEYTVGHGFRKLAEDASSK